MAVNVAEIQEAQAGDAGRYYTDTFIYGRYFQRIFCHPGYCQKEYDSYQYGAHADTFCGCGREFFHTAFCLWPEAGRGSRDLEKYYVEDTTVKHKLRFFYKGDSYKLLGFIPGDIHFFGTPEPDVYFPFGTDASGRDLYSRVLSALRISLSTGLVGVFFTFVLGCLFGGISGFYGGVTDTIIQRVIEFLMSMPSIPLWMALAAAFPTTWSSLKIYFAITIILSLIGWTTLARVVRGKLLELRNEDFVTAARVSGATDGYIIVKHLLPSFSSYLIVNVTLAIPSMILAETSLSFLGIGLTPPIVSLGVLLQDAQSINTVSMYPWMMIPGIFVVISVLAFNFVGDGLRDAADPYK